MTRPNFLSGVDASAHSAQVQLHSTEDDAFSQAACIFSDVVNMRIRPPARDEYMAAITVRLKPDSSVHPRSLLLELTDESDLFFYHSLLLNEADFHALKSEQRLLVDFQSFPSQVVELLRRCMEAAAASGISSATVAKGTANLTMLASLDCTSGGESIFSINESNQFRELTYIALRLRQGSDDAVKKYLATKLRGYRTESSDLAERLRSSDDTVMQLRRQVDDLSLRVRVASEEKSHLEQSLRAAHQQELADVRQDHARATIEAQQSANGERSRLESELKEALARMTARAESAERSNEDLQKQQLGLTASGKSCQERLDIAETQLQDAQSEVKTLREQVKQLELLKFQHEREIGERGVHLQSLQEQLSVKEQLVSTHTAQFEQANMQRKSLEDSLSMYKQQVSSLEEKFGASVQEINKGNQIIQKLRMDGKQLKAKLRLKVDELAQQEKSVQDLERAEESGRHVALEKEQELNRGKEREERLKHDIEELRKKLADAHEVLKTNQDVIEYLNRQLAERDLKALPPVLPAGSMGMEREPRNSALADLLKRTEGLGKTVKSHGTNATSSLANNFTLNSTGLSDLGFASGQMGYSTGTRSTITGSADVSSGLLTPGGFNSALNYTSPAVLASMRTGADIHGLIGMGSPSLGLGTREVSASSPNSVTGLSVGQSPMQGPVAYRSPSTGPPVAVK